MAQVTQPTQQERSIGFTWHAMDRITNRLGDYITYGQVQSVLKQAHLPKAGQAQVTITTLGKVVRVNDPALLNGYTQGDKIVARVEVMDGGTSVHVQTVVLIDQHSKYR